MHTKYSPIAPISILRSLFDTGHLDNYLLVLAHEVLAHPMEYERLILDMREASEDTFIILDNGVIEQGVASPLEDILEAAALIEPEAIALPDVLESRDQTLQLAYETAPLYSAEGYKPLWIPQGKTLDDVFSCMWHMNQAAGDSGVEYWGIPRWITNKFGSRQPILNGIARDYGGKVHLLGTSQYLSDDVSCARDEVVMGIDSANPIVLGIKGHPITIAAPHLPRGRLWEETIVTQAMLSNVQWMRNAVNG